MPCEKIFTPVVPQGKLVLYDFDVLELSELDLIRMCASCQRDTNSNVSLSRKVYALLLSMHYMLSQSRRVSCPGDQSCKQIQSL